jgi:Reverse transcriptase (RNA-dependent DNA polymerase)
MDKKMCMLEEAGTWETVDRPTDQNVVGSKWVFHVKHKANRSINKYKAQLVAHSFTQVYGVNNFDTFFPVVKLASI